MTFTLPIWFLTSLGWFLIVLGTVITLGLLTYAVIPLWDKVLHYFRLTEVFIEFSKWYKQKRRENK